MVQVGHVGRPRARPDARDGDLVDVLAGGGGRGRVLLVVAVTAAGLLANGYRVGGDAHGVSPGIVLDGLRLEGARGRVADRRA